MNMKKGKIFGIVTLIAAFALLAAGCVSSTAATVDVGGQQINTLYSVVGEKPITGTSKKTGTDGASTQLTYGNGSVSIDDVNAYITKLVDEEGYTVTQEVQNDGAGQSYQIGKATAGGKMVLIDFYFVYDGDTTITYQIVDGMAPAAGHP